MSTSSNYDPKSTTLSLDRDNGKILNLYFEPLYSRINKAVRAFKLYRSNRNGDSIFNHLSIPGEIGDNIPGLDVVNSKDYLGEFTFFDDTDSGWKYSGKLLSVREQQRVAAYIKAISKKFKAFISH
ncbi:hypothetical protein FFF34_009580 [Inquilinus sp. KBS0705]|nr:hypothetical protein FFF34_009580 [Inquilinus sp. KBS0705]